MSTRAEVSSCSGDYRAHEACNIFHLVPDRQILLALALDSYALPANSLVCDHVGPTMLEYSYWQRPTLSF